MCSMSTGHCSTHAPQFVQSHRTSSETTPGTRGPATSRTPPGPVAPDAARAVTRSKECGEGATPLSSRTASSSPAAPAPVGPAPVPESSPDCASPSERVTISLAEADSMWSRRPMTRSLGDRGFWVFHAGHSSWHLPHSVQA